MVQIWRGKKSEIQQAIFQAIFISIVIWCCLLNAPEKRNVSHCNDDNKSQLSEQLLNELSLVHEIYWGWMTELKE